MCMQNFIKILFIAHFICFSILTSAKPWPMRNGSWQSLGLDIVNINVYAKFDQNIPHGSRDTCRTSFTFSEFGHLDQSMTNGIWQSLGLDLIEIFHTIQKIGPVKVSEFGPRQSLNQWQMVISWARSCQYQCVCKILSKYSSWLTTDGHIFTNWQQRLGSDCYPNWLWTQTHQLTTGR